MSLPVRWNNAPAFWARVECGPVAGSVRGGRLHPSSVLRGREGEWRVLREEGGSLAASGAREEGQIQEVVQTLACGAAGSRISLLL